MPIAPFFTLGTYYAAGRYFYVHRRSHLDPEWGKKKIPWHYDHHMHSNQDANWCVTRPWFDYVMGTRVVSSADLKEANPLGIPLPAVLSKALAQAVEAVFPVKWVEQKPKLVEAPSVATPPKEAQESVA